MGLPFGPQVIRLLLRIMMPIGIKERAMGRHFTNMFLLKHSSEALELRSEAEYRLFSELKRALNDTEINDDGTDIGFVFNDSTIIFEEGKINVYRDHEVCAEYEIKEFSRLPNMVFRNLQQSLLVEVS